MPAPHNLTTLDQVFGLWDTQVEGARDVGVPWQRFAKWSQRKRIPPESFPAVIAAVRRKGQRISAAQLNKMNAPRATVRPAVMAGESNRA